MNGFAFGRDYRYFHRRSHLHDTLAKMAALIPAGEPSSMQVVGAQTFHNPNGVTRNITFEYDFSGKWFLMNVATLEKAGAATIVGFNVYPRPMSLEEENRFGLTGKSAIQYATLALIVVLPPVQAFSASAVAAPYGPWTLAVSVPVGAIVFLLRRRAMLALPR